MNTANAKLATVIEPSFEIVAENPAPSWDRARELWGEATKGAESLIELSFELVRLKTEFFSKGGRPLKNPSASGGVSEKGWEKTVEEELGINQQRARRLIEKGDGLFRLKAISEGEVVEWKDASGKARLTEPTKEKATLAKELIPDVVAGLVSARRAWAGVCGEGDRSEISKNRAPVDHKVVMSRAIKSLKAGMKVLLELEDQEQIDLFTEWAKLCDALPDNWAARAYKKASMK